MAPKPPKPSLALSPGQTFGRYTIEAAIGEGGMGAVYRAFDARLRRKVAIKVIHPEADVPDAAERLVREGHAAAQLAHPNTVAIHDLGELDGTVFLVMELVDGEPLRSYIGDSSIPLETRVGWLAQAARGLAAAHENGLVHRDVKPSNIMVGSRGGVKVLDFGLAKPVEASSLGGGAVVVGTPRYMAPELFRGLPADTRSDEYAFGITAYELLTGVYPGAASAAVPPAVDAVVPEAGADLARIVGRTMARSRDDRYGAMSEVANALERARAGGTLDTSPVSLVPATRREGAASSASPASPALALAKTELAPSGGAPVALRATLEPAPRGGASPFGVVAVLLALGGGVAYVARRDVVDEAAANATTADAGALTDAADGAEPAADAGVVEDAGLAPAAGASAEPDAGDDAGAVDGADVARPRFVIDDFQDPWLPKPAARSDGGVRP